MVFKTDGTALNTIQFNLGTITGVALPISDLALTTGSGLEPWSVDNTLGYQYLGTDGKIYLRCKSSTDKYIYFNFTYIV